MNLLSKSESYKPFKYTWAFETYKNQSYSHWLPEDINYADDLKDWNTIITNDEKSLLTQILRYFTQADVDVAGGYCDHFIPFFKNNEIRMALLTNAQMEVIHQESYSKIIDVLQMPESEYLIFKQYKEMKDKNDYLNQFNMTSPLEVAKTMAIYGAFTEGLQLFASFAMLLNFQRFGKMKSMCQVVAYSIRDEDIHVDFMIKLFKQYLEERLDDKSLGVLEIQYLGQDLEQIARIVVSMEDAFIDLAFTSVKIEGITKQEIKNYIRYIANKRMIQLGYYYIYPDNLNNPLKWIEPILNGVEFTNFFEGRVTAYAKGASKGSWDDAWN